MRDSNHFSQPKSDFDAYIDYQGFVMEQTVFLGINHVGLIVQMMTVTEYIKLKMEPLTFLVIVVEDLKRFYQ